MVNKKKLKGIIYILKMAAIGAVIGFIFQFVIFMNCKIPSESMESTLNVGDYIITNRLSYGFNMNLFGQQLISYKAKDPERFDIIVFRFPDDESELFIKRVIGLPGETVEIKKGKVYINGSREPIDDSFIEREATGDYGPYTVPDNEYFVMGDNRDNSFDSRFWDDHYVSFEQICGKAVLKYFPSTELL